ncbi:chemotaxis-specific protein-glutamate methyltransferase CheB [Natronobacterium gregoryi]|uniref:Protein-glutamate methylesterase/protein-glutamine glutaminase n=2 Tax=Natronobacterium gregoryi TaxID=44930 RepID=L0AGY2_NATGS|nr:chemotaxis-specific protein-glutamate methyltransferase CheB [Natronobacterium gregoryi]AFZ73138.1 chemotaxis response regulator containing a CheY-like receiver domain and a methylesterase domain [Natronobacterium gregoryi SP2]ELY70767.1 chemotaxis-specific methylesterase [Natronobacterium gregoryi SP2]PLK21549.1 chemotaxis-specific protein-glutamate methyltransferase CheB [Natronobacterium gregoryi SP2]SFI60403.1 two-component system, chemotaxis family, response regulator CheB [Natronobacte
MVRAVIADDSAVMRETLGKILEDGGIDVIGRAKNGTEAVELITDVEPDIATVDIQMPGLTGHEVIEQVMDERPTPMLVISSQTTKNAEATFEALEAGAVDFIAKPSGDNSVPIWSKQDEIVEQVRAVAKADISGSTDSGNERSTADELATVDVDATEAFPREPTLVIGASTGGPRVVERVLSELPERAGLRILIVQHMADHYTERFAERLDKRTDYDIREAAGRDTIGAGEGVLAKGGYHLAVSSFSNGKLTVTHDDGPKRHNVKPAIDVTMETAAETVTGNLAGVIMTGMGADGADGLAEIKAAGGKAIVQDEKTSRVYGMPKVAAEQVDVDMVLPEDRIAEGVVNAFRGWSS